mmetsp:Transcript_8931/g.17437  ORF Transcript_8931/g.17437 Transcript_8931/m.17437 type:complete len:178 (+) Transcript_8931:101-634(+)
MDRQAALLHLGIHDQSECHQTAGPDWRHLSTFDSLLQSPSLSLTLCYLNFPSGKASPQGHRGIQLAHLLTLHASAHRSSTPTASVLLLLSFEKKRRDLSLPRDTHPSSCLFIHRHVHLPLLPHAVSIPSPEKARGREREREIRQTDNSPPCDKSVKRSVSRLSRFFPSSLYFLGNSW